MVRVNSSDRLIKLYEDAEKKLVRIITGKSARGSPAYFERQILRQVNAELNHLKAATPSLVEQITIDGWKGGTANLISDLEAAGIDSPAFNMFSRINKRQIELLVENAVLDINKAVNLVGRRIEDEIREIGLQMAAERVATGTTVKDMQKALERRLYGTDEVRQKGGLIGVRYRNGRIVPLDTYSKMVARTTTAEAQNKSQFSQALGLGYGLVKCTKHTPTCEICALYQDRVYALTKEFAMGKLKGPDGESLCFPYLYDTALEHGYETIHPNCIHRFVVLPHRAYSREAVAKMSRNSTKPFADNRSDKERKKYIAGQVENRQRNLDYRQWQKYKALLPNDTPPFGSFRVMKKWDSERWQDLQGDYREIQKQLRETEPPEQLKF